MFDLFIRYIRRTPACASLRWRKSMKSDAHPFEKACALQFALCRTVSQLFVEAVAYNAQYSHSCASLCMHMHVHMYTPIGCIHKYNEYISSNDLFIHLFYLFEVFK